MSRALRSVAAWLVPPLLVFAAIGVGWEYLVRVRHVQRIVLPPPSAVWLVLHTDTSALWSNGIVTLEEMVIGFVFGAGFGFASATAMARARLIQRGLYPVLIVTQTIPPIALGVPLVVWLGFDIWPKIVLTALIVFFPVMVNSYQGLTQVDSDMLLLMRSMGASWWQTYLRVRLPASASLIFAALKLAATYCVIGAVFGETLGANRGLWPYLFQSYSALQIDHVYAAVVVLAGIGIVWFLLVVTCEYLMTPWRRRSTRRHWLRREGVSRGGIVP